MVPGGESPFPTRELLHPIRLRIWELYQRDPSRSLAPPDLLRDLPDCVEATLGQVKYHRDRMEHAGLFRSQ